METYHVIATHPQQLFFQRRPGGYALRRCSATGRAAATARAARRARCAGSFHHRSRYWMIITGAPMRSGNFCAPFWGMPRSRNTRMSNSRMAASTICFPICLPGAAGGVSSSASAPQGGIQMNRCSMSCCWRPGRRANQSRHRRRTALAHDEAWTNAPELGSLGKILDQDVRNLPYVHAGLKTKQPPYVILSGYQEGMIRNFQRNYEKALGLGGGIGN